MISAPKICPPLPPQSSQILGNTENWNLQPICNCKLCCLTLTIHICIYVVLLPYIDYTVIPHYLFCERFEVQPDVSVLKDDWYSDHSVCAYALCYHSYKRKYIDLKRFIMELVQSFSWVYWRQRWRDSDCLNNLSIYQ